MFCGRGIGPRGFSSVGPVGQVGSGWMFLSMGFKLIIFIALVFLAVKLFKTYVKKPNDAMTILSERFARGEISEEEYLKRRTILSQKN